MMYIQTNTLLTFFIIVPVLSGILLALNLLLAPHLPETEKLTTYECGFSPIHDQTRAPFTIHFLLFGVLFLAFDLEILLLFPLGLSLFSVEVYGFVMAAIFLIFLGFGFIYEIGSGALQFTNSKSSSK